MKLALEVNLLDAIMFILLFSLSFKKLDATNTAVLKSSIQHYFEGHQPVAVHQHPRIIPGFFLVDTKK